MAISPWSRLRRLRRAVAVLSLALLQAGCFATLKQASTHRLRVDEGLELNTGAGRGNFAPINRIGGQIAATNEEMFLASELRSAAKRGSWAEARRILSSYTGSSTKVLTAGMQVALRCRRYAEGATIFQQLKAREVAIDLPAYTLAMKIYGKLQEKEKVDEIWSILKDLDVVDQVAAGARIDAAVDFGDVNTALEVVQLMIKKRLGISVLHFSSAINACAKSEDPQRQQHAARLLEDMISRGMKPNIITYTNLLLASRDLPQQDLLLLLESMEKKGVKANSVFVENFVFAFLRKERGQGRKWKSVENIQSELEPLEEETLQKALELIEGFRKGMRLNKSTMLIRKALIGMLGPMENTPALGENAESTGSALEDSSESAETERGSHAVDM